MTESQSGPSTRLRDGAVRTFHRTGNALRLIGGLDRPRTGCTPYVELWHRDRASLRHYPGNAEPGRQPVLLVPSLINRSHIWDLRPGDSFIEHLLGHGYDVFLVDWGTPDERDAENAMSLYVDEYLSAAFATAAGAAGAPPLVIGHCFGGVIAALWATVADPQPPAMVALGVPTNWSEMGPLSQITRHGRLDPRDVLDETGNVPPGTMLRAFQLLRPLGDLTTYVILWDRLHDRRAAQDIVALDTWAHDHIPFPGRVFVEMVTRLSKDNALYTGEVMLGDRPRRLADIKVPFLNVYGTHDYITPPPSVTPLGGLVGRGETVAVKSGHIGLIIGKSARVATVPMIVDWLTSAGFAPQRHRPHIAVVDPAPSTTRT